MNTESRNSPGLIAVIRSVLAAFFGVQSERNRERDFTQGNPVHYIVMGLIATVAFILLIWGIVRLILTLAS